MQVVKYSTVLFLGSLWLLAPVKAGMIDKKGLAPYEICGLCHSLDGVSRMAKFPKLAGQPAPYLKQQLKAFIAGMRTNDGGQMAAIVTEIEPGTIDEIAAWFASQKHPAPSAVDATEAKKGQQVFEMNDCGSCHIGKAEQDQTVPYLRAQHAQYLEKQMNDFKQGDRQGEGPSERHGLKNIENEDIERIAMYLAGQERSIAE